MKLNDKGRQLQERGNFLWDKGIALDIEEHGEKEAEYGWSVIENHGLVTSVEDYCGIMLAAQDEGAIWYVLEGEPEDFSDFDTQYEMYYTGDPSFSLWDILYVLSTCGELDEEEKNNEYVKYALEQQKLHRNDDALVNWARSQKF